MWLLDANLDIHLADLLRSLQTDCDTAESRGWKALRNGELVAAAVNAGFSTLVTRDRLFADSAARAWRLFPDLCVVIVTLPQLPSTVIWRRLRWHGPLPQSAPSRGKLSSGRELRLAVPRTIAGGNAGPELRLCRGASAPRDLPQNRRYHRLCLMPFALLPP